MKYAKGVFEKVGDLNEGQRADAASLGEFVKSIVAAETPISSSDYNMSAPTEESATYEPQAPQIPERVAPPVTENAPLPDIAPPVNDDFDFIDVDDNPFA